MLPFKVEIRSGESPYRQVVYAATRAVVAGELPAGARFPSVRELSQALKINPNTAHKAVNELVRNGLLDVLPGIGTVVASVSSSSAAERRLFLNEEVEHLVVAAKRLGISMQDVSDAITQRWARLSASDDSSRQPVGAGVRGGKTTETRARR